MKTLTEQLDQIVDTHTSHLTKTADSDGTEIISFDEVVANVFEIKQAFLKAVVDRDAYVTEPGKVRKAPAADNDEQLFDFGYDKALEDVGTRMKETL